MYCLEYLTNRFLKNNIKIIFKKAIDNNQIFLSENCLRKLVKFIKIGLTKIKCKKKVSKRKQFHTLREHYSYFIDFNQIENFSVTFSKLKIIQHVKSIDLNIFE